MNDRETAIAEAAVRLFLRYGVRRTNMGEIAAEAGVARQTLYNTFASRDEVLRAAIRLHHQRIAQAVAAELPLVAGLEAQLNTVFRHMVLDPYATLHASPHAEDIVEGVNAVSQDELDRAAQHCRDQLEQVLTPHADGLGRNGQCAARVACLVQCAAAAARRESADLSQLQARIATLTAMVVALAGGTSATS